MKNEFDPSDENRLCDFESLPLGIPGGEPASREGYCIESSSAALFSLPLCRKVFSSFRYFQTRSY
jgi:hypothetical protein